MILQDQQSLEQIGIDWDQTVSVIEEAVKCLSQEDFAQPIKPYLRYRDLKNRIIAMPAFLGGNINMSGIKWIASFPDNIKDGIPRAHSVVILNNADTGEPVGIINTALLSVIRTASVSGLALKYFMDARQKKNLTVGMTGFGPIGKYHLKMVQALYGHVIDQVKIFDLKGINPEEVEYDNVEIVDSWQEAYHDADVFMTCTVSDKPYVNLEPKVSSLHLNVSLRDYTVDVIDWFRGAIIVDDWEEVCREKTDIEMMHLEKGLEETDTFSLVDMITNNCLSNINVEQPIIFNPMGMAVFDIAIGNYYYQAEKNLSEALAE